MKSGGVFQTVKTEGAILPADLLRRLVNGDRDVPGLRAEDYHLAKSERLNEAATRAWNRVRGAWEGFKDAMEALPEADAGTSLTREKWLQILFQELGYGRLTTRKAYELEDKTYPISHEWQNTPIHLISFRLELDKRTPGRAGAARVSPHSLVQELINRSNDLLWGFVSNGLSLRLLRDNVSLTRRAYIEFDLQAMMDSEAYSDFFLLYLLCHQSRVEVPEGKGPEHCWLEKWYNTAAQQGVRALDQLRDGVQKAIEVFGGGFLAYPTNAELREKLRSGTVSTQDYYRQILRQVYRLLFLFVAEDRELLFDPASPAEARKLYTDYYSAQRLRTLAARTRGTRHPDLWRGLRLVLSGLHSGCLQLGLPALGSFLFSAQATADLNDRDISNADLLKAIRALTFTVDRNVLRPVNYRNLGPEELGSVYESLLEMHPAIHIQATNPEDRFRLKVTAGSERKTTGSYYTPTGLVHCLLDSALDPILEEARKKSEPEKALLALKVCDPACGSGHFLIAAAHRIAKRVASVRAGEDEPSPEHYQHALRDVIGRCIYGVDVNPMSVELCKVSLWMEAMEPGKPLAFLEHHIKCGNSLLGTTPALLKKGIPDEAFKPIKGDDNAYCKDLKKQNKSERKDIEQGQATLFHPWERLGDLATAMVDLDDMPDDTPETMRKKQERYDHLVKSSGYLFGHLWADAWCAVFVWKKVREHDGGLSYAITEKDFRAVEKNPHAVPQWMKAEVQRLARGYEFFHWHLEFPDVFRMPQSVERPANEQTGWSGGFDCVLGNPPWDMQEVKDNEFFASSYPEILSVKSAKDKAAILERIEAGEPALWSAYQEYVRMVSGQKHFMLSSGRYPLSAVGRLNLYRIFLETNHSIISAVGRVGVVIPSGFASDSFSQGHFNNLHEGGRILSLYDFENRQGLFPAIDSRTKFCLLTVCGPAAVTKATDFVFFAHGIEELADPERHVAMSANDLRLLNPLTGTAPLFQSNRERLLTIAFHRNRPIVASADEDGWRIKPVLMFMVNASMKHHRTAEELETEGLGQVGNRFVGDEEWFPLYEGKMVGMFDHRAASIRFDPSNRVRRNQPDPLSSEEHDCPDTVAQPLFWISRRMILDRCDEVPRFCLVVKDVTSSTNERTSIGAMLPPSALTDSVPWLTNPQGALANASLVANLNSFAFDFSARQKVAGLHLRGHYLAQLPLVSLKSLEMCSPWQSLLSLERWLGYRSLELSFTAWDLRLFAHDCSYDGLPFRWDEERRFLIRCELDAAFFHLYLGSEEEWKQKGSKELLAYFPTPSHAVEYTMDTFPIVKRKDEQAHGHYRTKDTILEIYDEMARVSAENGAAVAAGRQPIASYQTRLNPPPGPPCDAQGYFIPMTQWDRASWPSHIHPPKEIMVTKPEEVPVAAFAEMAYPTDADKAICAAALALVEQSGGLSSIEHLDALLLATHSDWCKAFLDKRDQAAFDAARKSAPTVLFVGQDQSIHWKACREYLEQCHAIAVHHSGKGQPINTGAALVSVKASLPGGVDTVVVYARKALARIDELRKNLTLATQEQQTILSAVDNHRSLQLAA